MERDGLIRFRIMWCSSMWHKWRQVCHNSSRC